MSKLFILSPLFTVMLIACNGNQSPKQKIQEVPQEQILDTSIQDIEVVEIPEKAPYIVDTLKQKIIDAGLIDIQTISPDILIDVRYSDTNNFMQKNVYGHLNRIYLQPSVAEDLGKSLFYLKSIDSSLTLLVYDGVRPRSVQQYMWDVLDMPINEKVKFVSNPANGSLHNFGAAVDLTIADLDGNPLDMGAGYDDIRKIAYPRHEKAYLDSGLLTKDHIANRELLREVMKAGGFWNIATEWWHFNRYSRDRAKTMFEIVE